MRVRIRAGPRHRRRGGLQAVPGSQQAGKKMRNTIEKYYFYLCRYVFLINVLPPGITSERYALSLSFSICWSTQYTGILTSKKSLRLFFPLLLCNKYVGIVCTHKKQRKLDLESDNGNQGRSIGGRKVRKYCSFYRPKEQAERKKKRGLEKSLRGKSLISFHSSRIKNDVPCWIKRHHSPLLTLTLALAFLTSQSSSLAPTKHSPSSRRKALQSAVLRQLLAQVDLVCAVSLLTRDAEDLNVSTELLPRV